MNGLEDRDAAFVVEFLSEKKIDKMHYFDLECESVKCSIFVGDNVQVIVDNASHRAFQGMGKTFATFEDALSNYKSPKLKAMIGTVQNIMEYADEL